MKAAEQRIWILVMWTVGISLFASVATGEDPYAVAWSRQLGTTEADWSYSVAVDAAGNAFIGGRTRGSLGGTNAGSDDAYLAKYDPAGTLLWTEQLGTTEADYSSSVAVDGSGNAFISGRTTGSLGGSNKGYEDAFLAKYSSSGVLQWTQQLGTSAIDTAQSIAVDSAGNAFISGSTRGSLGGTNAGDCDAYLAKYDPNGILLWAKQLGTSDFDASYSVAVDDAGNAFISGDTIGNLGGTNAGARSAFLAKYNPAGNLLWTEQLGTSDLDVSVSVVVDSFGNAFISGYTDGSLGGTSAGGKDAFLVKFAVPTVTLTVLAEPDDVGIDTVWPTIGEHVYVTEWIVDLRAEHYPHCPAVYRLDHWEGDVADPCAETTTILMDSDKTVTAVFVDKRMCGDECHPNFLLGDLNHDCAVDLGDLDVLNSRWMTCTKPECD